MPALLAGCSLLPPKARRALAAPYKPSNIYLRQAPLPEGLRRVAVLPVPASRDDTSQAAGVELLQPLFLDALNKRHAFELLALSPAQVREVTGSDTWAAEDSLPHDFFERLTRATGCDGVIFVSVTAFQAYPPLRTGWKTRLVDCARHQTWWAVDEVFDAGAESVAAAADAYARVDLNLPNALLADTGVLHSPRRFGQYTAHAVAGTLPGR